jgi:hypothetical protein
MPASDVVDVIHKKMDSNWDGLAPRNPTLLKPTDPPWPHGARGLAEWSQKMVEWGNRVRRDILVLEHHLAQLKAPAKPDDLFYGDPGDPPPTPIEPN